MSNETKNRRPSAFAKDVDYRLSAIQYNEGFAVFAENMANEVAHPEIQRWCRGIARQHEKHAEVHKKALAALTAEKSESAPETAEATTPVEASEVQA